MSRPIDPVEGFARCVVMLDGFATFSDRSAQELQGDMIAVPVIGWLGLEGPLGRFHAPLCDFNVWLTPKALDARQFDDLRQGVEP